MKNRADFENILNECLERIFKGESLESCLKEYPHYAAELEPLLKTALEGRQAARQVLPRSEFKARARYEFMTAVRDMAEKKPKRAFSLRWVWHSGWAMALIAVLVVVTGGGGTVVAASNSMPDDALYPVKLATEEAKIAVTATDIGKAELYAELAGKRVNEIIYIAAKGDAKRVEDVSERLNNHLKMLDSLTRKAGANGVAIPTSGAPGSGVGSPEPRRGNPGVESVPPSPSPKPVTTASPDVTGPPTLTTTATQTPSSKATPKSSPQGTPEKTRARALTREQQAKIAEREKLKTMVTNNKNEYPARLDAALKQAPPSVKPALKKAISDAVAAYEQAIKNIDEEDDTP